MIELIYNEQSATTTTATAAAAKRCRSRTVFSYCWLDISDVMLTFDRIILNAKEFCMLRGFLFAFRKLYENYVASAIWCHLVLETCSFKSIETGSCAVLFLSPHWIWALRWLCAIKCSSFSVIPINFNLNSVVQLEKPIRLQNRQQFYIDDIELIQNGTQRRRHSCNFNRALSTFHSMGMEKLFEKHAPSTSIYIALPWSRAQNQWLLFNLYKRQFLIRDSIFFSSWTKRHTHTHIYTLEIWIMH